MSRRTTPGSTGMKTRSHSDSGPSAAIALSPSGESEIAAAAAWRPPINWRRVIALSVCGEAEAEGMRRQQRRRKWKRERNCEGRGATMEEERCWRAAMVELCGWWRPSSVLIAHSRHRVSVFVFLPYPEEFRNAVGLYISPSCWLQFKPVQNSTSSCLIFRLNYENHLNFFFY